MGIQKAFGGVIGLGEFGWGNWGKKGVYKGDRGVVLWGGLPLYFGEGGKVCGGKMLERRRRPPPLGGLFPPREWGGVFPTKKRGGGGPPLHKLWGGHPNNCREGGLPKSSNLGVREERWTKRNHTQSLKW